MRRCDDGIKKQNTTASGIADQKKEQERTGPGHKSLLFFSVFFVPMGKLYDHQAIEYLSFIREDHVGRRT